MSVCIFVCMCCLRVYIYGGGGWPAVSQLVSQLSQSPVSRRPLAGRSAASPASQLRRKKNLKEEKH